VPVLSAWRGDCRSAHGQESSPEGGAPGADCPQPQAAAAHPAPAMTRAAFERRVAEALATIPRRFRDAMANIAIVVEDEPSDELLDDMEIEPPDTLFGLYQGTPLTERGWAFGNNLPDQILLFQGPHEREAEDQDDLIVSIGETLIHEIGHYFGMSEEEIEEIEEKYWHRQVR
jgi:predicted Zn-dependent protease with MMP-like domain